jgi:hypothetical protein
VAAGCSCVAEEQEPRVMKERSLPLPQAKSIVKQALRYDIAVCSGYFISHKIRERR